MRTNRRGRGHIPLQKSRDCIVASIQVDLDEEVLHTFREDLLGMLHRAGAVAVILDVSGVDLMDGEDFRALRKIMAMTELMGSRCIVAGLQAGVVASLVELDVDLEGLETTLNLDAAFEALENEQQTEAVADPNDASTSIVLSRWEEQVPWEHGMHMEDDAE